VIENLIVRLVPDAHGSRGFEEADLVVGSWECESPVELMEREPMNVYQMNHLGRSDWKLGGITDNGCTYIFTRERPSLTG